MESLNDFDSIARGVMQAVPFLERWGVSLGEVQPGTSATMQLAPRDEVVGPYGGVLGGVLVTVADIAAGVCAAVAWRASGIIDVMTFHTESMAVQFLRPVLPTVVDFRAVVVKLSRKRAVIEVACVPRVVPREESLRVMLALVNRGAG
jgi:acyl-coenzyme A thioesterase PaaI-like protein